MTYNEDNTNPKIDDFRIFVFDLLKDVTDKDDFDAIVELLIAELEQFPTFAEYREMF